MAFRSENPRLVGFSMWNFTCSGANRSIASRLPVGPGVPDQVTFLSSPGSSTGAYESIQGLGVVDLGSM